MLLYFFYFVRRSLNFGVHRRIAVCVCAVLRTTSKDGRRVTLKCMEANSKRFFDLLYHLNDAAIYLNGLIEPEKNDCPTATTNRMGKQKTL